MTRHIISYGSKVLIKENESTTELQKSIHELSSRSCNDIEGILEKAYHLPEYKVQRSL
jgi:hypothetical protein